MFYKIARALVFFIVRLWFKVEVKGRENLPKKGGYIVIANHQHLLDPVFVTLAVIKKLSIMGKKELFENKFLSSVFTSLGAFPVDRGKGDMSVIETAEKNLKNGEILLIFPEGTRSKSGKLLRFKNGATLIARETGADVLPVVINYKNGVRIFGKIEIAILPIIENSLLSDGEGMHAMRNATHLLMDRISGGLEELRS